MKWFYQIDWTVVQGGTVVVYTLITGLGTLYVIKTFRQQRDINDKQREINNQQFKLNNYHLAGEKRKIKPSFIIGENYGWSSDDNIYKKQLILTNAAACDVRIKYSQNSKFKFQKQIENKNSWQINEAEDISFEIRVIGGPDIFELLVVEFADEMKSQVYEQVVIYKDRPSITSPVVIEKYSEE